MPNTGAQLVDLTAPYRTRGNTHSVPLNKLPEDLQAVLAPFDIDGDGMLNMAELSVIANNYRKSKKKLRRAVWFVIALVSCFVVLIAANVASGIAIAQLTKEVEVKADSAGTAFLADTAGNPIATSQNIKKTDMLELASHGPDFDYTGSVRSVVLPTTDNSAAKSYQVVGSEWFSSTEMDLHLTMGLTLQLVSVIVDGIASAEIRLVETAAAPAVSGGRALADSEKLDTAVIAMRH